MRRVVRKLPRRKGCVFVEAQGADVDLVHEGGQLAGDAEVAGEAETVGAVVANEIRSPKGWVVQGKH